MGCIQSCQPEHDILWVMESVCFYCKHWILEPGALNERKKTILARTGSNLPGIYGKCQAEFEDQYGERAFYDMGTTSSMECRAVDDQGNQLFEENPED